MKPAPFEYHAPKCLEEALSLLQELSDACLLAGGQTLIPMMNFRLAAPRALIDLNGIDSLNYIKAEDGFVRIGAMTRQRTIEFSPVASRDVPLLAQAMRHVGHLPTRSRGTIGGSIANADSAAELPMILQVLEGHVTVASADSLRTIAAKDLFTDAMTTTIEPEEILTEIGFPIMPQNARYAIEEFSRRRGDFAIAAVAAVLEVHRDKCVKARIATAGISASSARLLEAEQALESNVVSDKAIAEAAHAASSSVDPLCDRNASDEYRRHLAGVLTRRVLYKAMEMA